MEESTEPAGMGDGYSYTSIWLFGSCAMAASESAAMTIIAMTTTAIALTKGITSSDAA